MPSQMGPCRTWMQPRLENQPAGSHWNMTLQHFSVCSLQRHKACDNSLTASLERCQQKATRSHLLFAFSSWTFCCVCMRIFSAVLSQGQLRVNVGFKTTFECQSWCFHQQRSSSQSPQSDSSNVSLSTDSMDNYSPGSFMVRTRKKADIML